MFSVIFFKRPNDQPLHAFNEHTILSRNQYDPYLTITISTKTENVNNYMTPRKHTIINSTIKPNHFYLIYVTLLYIYVYMNPFLYEPYSAWQKSPRKKHWHEIVEEEQLMARIIAEQQATQQQIQNQAAAPAGAGGVPPYEFFNSSEIVDFSGTPTSAAGPVTVSFTNLTTTQDGDNYLWIFGDGQTSTSVNPTHIYTNTGSYTVELQVTNSSLQHSENIIKESYITASVPTVISSFTYTTSSTDDGFTASFTASATTDNSQTLTGLWLFGDTTSASYSDNTPFIHIYPTGSFTASLSVTESFYGITSSLYTASFSQSSI